MVTDRQVRRLFEVQNKYKYQYQAADAAGISSKTARRDSNPQPSDRQPSIDFLKSNGNDDYGCF